MHPELLRIGGFGIYSWGFMLSVAVLLGLFGARCMAARKGIDPDRVVDFTLLVVILGLLGARLFYVLFYDWDYFATNPLEILNPYHQGLVFQGALVLGILATVWFVRHYRIDFWNFADILSPFVSLGYGIVRIGCFLAGCCYGKATDLPWGVIFPGLGDVERHPTQLYSSLFGLLLFGYLLWLFPRRTFKGQVFLNYLIIYSLGRFFIENFRDNPRFWGPFTLAQVVGVIVLAAAFALYFWLRRENSRKE